MRCLLAVVVFTLAAGDGLADDGPKNRAKEVSQAFLKAVKARDLDAATKLTATPFFHQHVEKGELLDGADAVKLRLGAAIEKITGSDMIPKDVVELVPAAKVRERFAQATPEMRAMIEKAIGKDGYVVLLGRDGRPAGGLLVATKDGKAKIVGIPR